MLEDRTLLAADFGDAPDTAAGTGAGNYETTSANSGASHTIDTTQTTLFLGNTVDGDSGTVQNASANADDIDGALPDDEDGVLSPLDLRGTIGAAPTVTLLATNTTGSAATLSGWIDYNQDGVFDNATERAQIAVPTGTTDGRFTLTFPTIPAGSAGATYARFRLSTDVAAANSTGRASDGEVEDYVFSITAPPTVSVNIVDGSLNDGDNTSTVTFEFSENVVGFDISDVSASGGEMSGFVSVNANSFIATFTGTDGTEATGSVTVGTSYTDTFGNAGAGGSDSVSIDTRNPRVLSFTRQSPSSQSTSATSLVFRATFSETVSGVDPNDFDVFGASTAAVSNVSAVSGTVVDVTVSGGNLATFEGPVGLNLNASQNVVDSNGNSLLTVEPTADETFTLGSAPGITASAPTSNVDEAGTTATFTLQLDAPPASNVVLNVSSGDTGEIAVAPSALTFTPANFAAPQTVTVIGQPDSEIADGNVSVTITVSVNDGQSDATYQSVDDVTVNVVNRSHRTRNTFALIGRGRVGDFVDVVSTTGNGDLDIELRATDGTILSPGIDGRISLVGYPAGTYEIWVNDNPGNYDVTPNPGLGTAIGEPAAPALDLDGDNSFTFANDGILLLAYSLGSRGSALDAFRAPGDHRTGAEIEAVIEQLADALDLDADSQFSFASDGILLLAHSLGSTGDALNPFRSQAATRTGTQISSRLADLFQTSSNRQQTPDEDAFGVVTFWAAPGSSEDDNDEVVIVTLPLESTTLQRDGDNQDNSPEDVGKRDSSAELIVPADGVESDETLDGIFSSDSDLSVHLLSL